MALISCGTERCSTDATVTGTVGRGGGASLWQAEAAMARERRTATVWRTEETLVMSVYLGAIQ